MSSTCRVSPFGNLRIDSYLPIPAAYRSLSRPSSPPRAKASPVYSLLLSSTRAPFAPHGMLFCSCHDVSYYPKDKSMGQWAQTQQSPIVVCSSFLTSSNMSKNFLKFPVKSWKLKVSLLLTFYFLLFTSKWRITESNRWPPACKAGALASWANPPKKLSVVPSRFELETPTLSV